MYHTFHRFLRLPSIPRFVTLLEQKLFISTCSTSFRHLNYNLNLWSWPNNNEKSFCHVSAHSNRKYDEVSSILTKYGFSDDQIKHIIAVEPQMLDLEVESIAWNIGNWMSEFRMKQEHLFGSLASCPRLLMMNPQFVNNRIKELLTVFTQKDVIKLLKTCPQAFLDDWNVLMEKMQYLIHYMGAEQKSIIKCGALQLDIDNLKKRHAFLLYAGKYKTPNEKKPQRNPPLGIIFSKSISKYLKLTGLSEEEYLVFSEVFPEMDFENLLNFDNETSDEEEDDDDDDEDDNGQ